MRDLATLKTKIFADGADLSTMLELYGLPYIKGFTTNPTLMRRAGVTDYRAFAHAALRAIRDRPISFEVFSDELREMERQAREIASWGENVYVKIPVTNTRGDCTGQLVRRLSQTGIKVNVTAVMTQKQVTAMGDAVRGGAPSYLSIFAGRIADTGRDPMPLLVDSLAMVESVPTTEIIWASPRELLNLLQANEIGCHIITVTADILKKLCLIDRSLDAYSLDTVKMFYTDAQAAGFAL